MKKTITSKQKDTEKEMENNPSIFKDIISSITGKSRDYTTTKLSRAILLLSVPMVLEMFMESIFVVADIFFVSKLGADAISTVGMTESIFTIIYALSIGLSSATAALISRRIGEKNFSQASIVAVQSIFLGIAVSVYISMAGIFWAKDMLRVMGATEEMISTGYMYTTVMFGGNIVVMLLFIINSIFRSSGDATISLWTLIIANLLNIVLDPCFIFGLGPFPELGIQGAAIATTIGRGTAVVFQLYILFRGNLKVKLSINSLKFDLKIMKRILKLSIGGIGQSIIATSSWIGLMRIMAVFDKNVIAGYIIAIRIILFPLLPSWGMANAAATLVGQNLGAKKPERAEKAVWMAGFVNMAFLSVFSIAFLLFPNFFVKLFIDDIDVINSGALALQFISAGYLFYAFGMVMAQAFNGAGDTFTPTITNFICFWVLEIPLAYALAIPLGLDERGVYIAILCAEGMIAALGIILFKRGKWKLKMV